MACSGRRVQLALAPAGTGKTTAMGILATAWRNSGGDIVALAPQAAAAQQLVQGARRGEGRHAGQARLRDRPPRRPPRPRPAGCSRSARTPWCMIDEAGLASTHNLDVAIRYVLGRGGSVRLVGDDRQLAATTAGGLLRDICRPSTAR